MELTDAEQSLLQKVQKEQRTWKGWRWWCLLTGILALVPFILIMYCTIAVGILTGEFPKNDNPSAWLLIVVLFFVGVHRLETTAMQWKGNPTNLFLIKLAEHVRTPPA